MSRRSVIVFDVISFIMEVSLVLLLTRIIFRVVGLTSVTPFLSHIYDITNVLVMPFRQLFVNPVINDKYVFDITALLAFGVYTAFYYVFSLVVKKLKTQDTDTAVMVIEGEIVRESVTPAY